MCDKICAKYSAKLCTYYLISSCYNKRVYTLVEMEAEYAVIQ